MTNEIKNTAEDWENGTLGRDEEFVRVSDVDGDSIDQAVGLQMISIRLQKSLIEDLKMIAELNGIGYQPLIKQVLKRFSDAEKKKILQERYHETMMRRKVEQESSTTSNEPLAGCG